MTAEVDRLGVFGAVASFAAELPVGQLYFPDWESYVHEMRGIFDREYFTNHGPLTRQLEAELATFLGVRHALCVTNATVGLIIAATALSLKGKVVLPAFTFIACPQALTWAGLEPCFCDVDLATGHLSAELIEPLLAGDVAAIMGVNLWGGTCNPPELEKLAESCGIPLFFDSAQAFGCGLDGRRVGSYGAAEVFSFHATKIVNGGEGGCITTNDDQLAARMRNIRSSYGSGPAADIPITTNGRFSEAQAALTLLGLHEFDAHRDRNAALWSRYAREIDAVPGISCISPSFVDQSNWQSMNCVIDPGVFGLGRDELLRVLKAERVNARRYFYPGCHRSLPYSESLPQYRDALPNTDQLCRTVLQLPLGALVSDGAADDIVELIGLVHRNAEEVADRLGAL